MTDMTAWPVRCRECMVRLAPRATSGLALTRAQAFLDPEVLSRDPDRARPPDQVGVHALQPITRQRDETPFDATP